MTDRSIFGEMQCVSPSSSSSAGARSQNHTPCHGLFGARLFPDGACKAPEPGIAPGELPQSFS
jgi:hypothetical protein